MCMYVREILSPEKTLGRKVDAYEWRRGAEMVKLITSPAIMDNTSFRRLKRYIVT